MVHPPNAAAAPANHMLPLITPPLQRFFKDHDPTRRAKPQYKSALWYHSPEQQQVAQAMMAGLEAKYGVKVATTLDPEQPWYDAEEYHQQYMVKAMGGAGRW